MTTPDRLDRLDRWLRPEAPLERLAAVRVLVGAFATVYLLARLRYFADFTGHVQSDFTPIGICSFLPSPLPRAVTIALALLAPGIGATFTLGRRLRIVAPLFFVLLLWVTTYASSWGKILHSENVMVLHVGALALAYRHETPDRHAAGWALRLASIATVLTYVLAGITKLRAGGSHWLSGEALGTWLAYDALRKIELGSFHSPLAGPLAGSPRVLQALAIYTLLVELGAPLALVRPGLARGWALLTWGFHVGVLLSMAIGFYYPLTGVAFAPLFALERLPVLRRLVPERGRSEVESA